MPATGRLQWIGDASAIAFLLMSATGAVAASKLPITEAEKQQVWDRGALSGHGERCGFDWQELNFLPMMRYWRAQGKTEQQMAVIGALHGVAQGQAKAVGPVCTAEYRDKLRELLKFKP